MRDRLQGFSARANKMVKALAMADSWWAKHWREVSNGRPGGRTDDERHWPGTGLVHARAMALEVSEMSDLVEVAREGLNECKELDLQLSPAQELIAAMADEIERLQKDVENLDGSLRNVRQATLDDLREWGGGKTIYDERTFRDHIDEYEKDRNGPE